MIVFLWALRAEIKIKMTENISFSKLSNYTWDWLDQRSAHWPMRGLETCKLTNQRPGHNPSVYKLPITPVTDKSRGWGLGSKHESGACSLKINKQQLEPGNSITGVRLIKYIKENNNKALNIIFTELLSAQREQFLTEWKSKDGKVYSLHLWELKLWCKLEKSKLRSRPESAAKRRVVQGRAGTGELNYLSQFDIKGSDQILRRALTENCHIHSDSDWGQDTIMFYQLFT